MYELCMACVHLITVLTLHRYQRKYPSKKTKVRHKSIRLSQDHGYFEDGDDDDAKSTKSVPATRIARPSRHGNRVSYIIL